MNWINLEQTVRGIIYALLVTLIPIAVIFLWFHFYGKIDPKLDPVEISSLELVPTFGSSGIDSLIEKRKFKHILQGLNQRIISENETRLLRIGSFKTLPFVKKMNLLLTPDSSLIFWREEGDNKNFRAFYTIWSDSKDIQHYQLKNDDGQPFSFVLERIYDYHLEPPGLSMRLDSLIEVNKP